MNLDNKDIFKIITPIEFMTENISLETEKRYLTLWKRLEASKYDLNDLETDSQQEFERKTAIKGKGQYNLARSLARNIERQEVVNKQLDTLKIPKTYTKRIEKQEYIPKYQKKLPDIKFHKSKYGLQGYQKESTSFHSKTHSRKDIKEHYKKTKEVINKSSNPLIIDQKKKNYAIQTKISLTVFNPKDSTTSEMVFYGNGRLYNKLYASLNDTDKFLKRFDDFTSRLIQSELTYTINLTQTTLRVVY